MDSGLRPTLCLDCLIKILEDLSHSSGWWLFQEGTWGEQRMITTSFREEFGWVLFAICDEDSSLFKPTMDIVMEGYHVEWSLCWRAAAQATNTGVSQPDIDWINHWNTAGKDIRGCDN
jgi:hypothetical protein